MIKVRRSEDRGHANHGWLDSWHSFSFASYIDPRHMGLSALRVINQDVIAAKSGFGTHPHNNMEILTYVLRGAVTHEDSMGTKAAVRAGDFQLMSAGTGVAHSEYNLEDTELELLQIWLFPNVQNATPTYQQKNFEDHSGLQLVVSPDGHDESLVIRQDARIYRGRLKGGENLNHRFVGTSGWLQVIKGELRGNDVIVQAGDALHIEDEKALSVTAHTDTEFLLFDLP